MPTLLCVDDSLDILALRSAVLGSAGFRVICCDTARKALACLHTSDVDLVITDYNMPSVDGLCMAKQARANGFSGPIVLATAADGICELGRNWVNQVIGKTEHPDVLLDAVRAFLQVAEDPAILSRELSCAA